MNAKHRNQSGFTDFLSSCPFLLLGLLIANGQPWPDWANLLFMFGWLLLAGLIFGVITVLISSRTQAKIIFFAGGLVLLSVVLYLVKK